MSCGVRRRCRCNLDPELLCLWCRPAATAPTLGNSICRRCGPEKQKKKKKALRSKEVKLLVMCLGYLLAVELGFEPQAELFRSVLLTFLICAQGRGTQVPFCFQCWLALCQIRPPTHRGLPPRGSADCGPLSSLRLLSWHLVTWTLKMQLV